MLGTACPCSRDMRIWTDRHSRLWTNSSIQGHRRHVRFVHSSNENSLMAYLYKDGEKTYEEAISLRFNILDRVGGGDAFPAAVFTAHGG